MKTNSFLLTTMALLALGASSLRAGEKTVKQVVTPTPEDTWQVRLSMPAWAAGVHGDVGFGGHTTGLDLYFDDILPHIDMVGSFRAEVRKGRFGGYIDFLHISLSDGIGTESAVKKLTVRQDQYLGDLGLSWRVLDGPRGYLEVIGGARYTSLFHEVNLEGNDQQIEALSSRLAAAGTITRGLLGRELAPAEGGDASVPTPPLASGQIDKLTADLRRVRGNTAERQKRIERRLESALNQRLARLDDWVDPYIGIQGRYNFTPTVYLNGRADIGGFGVGSEVSWKAAGGIGWQFAEHKFVELSYRALGVDYEDDGFVWDTVMRGFELTLGINF